MTDPRIYLAVDNCFASKRWTAPAEWAQVVKSLGLYYVEASADNECDPLYMGGDYMERWCADVVKAAEETGVRVANLYSGHGTYATLGLAHTDPEVRKRFLECWLKPMCDTAAKLGAGLGFFCHAFADSVLQEPIKYQGSRENLFNSLANLAKYAERVGCSPVGVEQMYSPHQIPWTVKGAHELIEQVCKRADDAPFYITVDVGHQSGQRRFLRPSREELRVLLEGKLSGSTPAGLWLGANSAYDIYDRADGVTDSVLDAIEADMDAHRYMFAAADDGDTYNWLGKLGCYSPIIHLQQTNGVSSSHLPFTDECNEKGIIKGEKVLRALAAAYAQPDDPMMPPKPEKIFLTLEMFTGTADINRDALSRMAQTVSNWRKFIPEDGLTLKQLNERL